MSKIVRRTLDFIELFAEQKRPLALSEISKLLDIPVSSCHDVLHSLQERGYVYEIGPRAGYYPTRKLQHLVEQIAAHDPVLLRAELLLRELRQRFDQSVSIARVSGEQAIYLLSLEPSHPLRFLVRIGDSVRSLYATSAGKALLGSLEPARLRSVLDRLTLKPFTPNTVTSREALLAEIEQSRARGWYINREESVPTATTVSAAFTWNRSVFIITLAGPTYLIEPQLDDIVTALLETCRQLEAPGGTPN
jgi:IclR family acetate operon transcriptional repressor